MTAFELRGVNGANPLGFLTAVGTLATLRRAGANEVRLGWKRATSWIPLLDGVPSPDANGLCEALAAALKGRAVAADADGARRAAQRAFDAAKLAAERTRKELGGRRLRGAERDAAYETELRPLERDREAKRATWLKVLANAVPRPELALGKRIDCTSDEFREHAERLLHAASSSDREALDLLAAFGGDACGSWNADAVEPTPFCFIRGSGQQFFLDTVRQLTAKVERAAIERTLFEPWRYGDPGLSMRWDPVEDKRYALTDADPGDDGSRTEWMANLLAYRALALFPCAPTRRGLRATGWTIGRDGDPAFTWPIWEPLLSCDTVRSLLQAADLALPTPDLGALRARGVVAVYRARRIKVGQGANYKLNFTPARAL